MMMMMMIIIIVLLLFLPPLSSQLLAHVCSRQETFLSIPLIQVQRQTSSPAQNEKLQEAAHSQSVARRHSWSVSAHLCQFVLANEPTRRNGLTKFNCQPIVSGRLLAFFSLSLSRLLLVSGLARWPETSSRAQAARPQATSHKQQATSDEQTTSRLLHARLSLATSLFGGQTFPQSSFVNKAARQMRRNLISSARDSAHR